MEPRDRLRSGDLVDVATALAASLEAHAEGLDGLDVWGSADGDTGANLTRTAAVVAAAVGGDVPPRSPTHWADAVRRAVAAGGTGRSGCRLAAFLDGMASVIAGRDDLDGTGLALAYEAGSEAVDAVDAGDADGGSAGTDTLDGIGPMPSMAQPARAAARAALAAADDRGDLARVAVAAADAALDRLEAAAQIDELRGEGVVDAGSAGLCVLYDVVVVHVHGGDPGDLAGPDDDTVRSGARVDDPLYTFCCVLEGEDLAAAPLEAALSSVAEPAEVTGGEDGRVAIRAATDELGAVIEVVCSFGRPRRVVVEDRRSRG